MSDAASVRAPSGQFLPGQSGNPAGRPRGARNKASLLFEQLEDGESAAIVRRMIDRALAGHSAALHACFAKMVVPVKQAPVELDLPKIRSAADAAEAGSELMAAVAAGEITLGEGEQAMKMLATQLKMIEAAERRHSPGDDAGSAHCPVARSAPQRSPVTPIQATPVPTVPIHAETPPPSPSAPHLKKQAKYRKNARVQLTSGLLNSVAAAPENIRAPAARICLPQAEPPDVRATPRGSFRP
ncbi:DUF5681 domain-containing protein [Allosphingosinicella deserti]|uniref:DUF5681 domain-containing protein n=1 Tax=Allosphingosinicella deserti TaxID=2116704 RepID=A0A2P7QSM8_9SPHN|nr:DUF5681 domain-containing protein [Sphingomonas deserti]PSJ40966.1 hypothetical protein C7I55_11955 [Sphingomonas deserti]